MQPAVYNANRLREKPIPITQVDGATQKKRSKSVTKQSTEKRQPTKNNSPNISGIVSSSNSPAAIDDNEEPTPNISTIDTPPNSPVPLDDNEGDTNMSNDVADEVICLSDFANLSQHRPMYFDVISGGYSFQLTVIIFYNTHFFTQLICIEHYLTINYDFFAG